MVLTVQERLVAAALLQGPADIMTLRVMQEMIRKIGLSAEEIELFKVRTEGEKILWDEDLAMDVNVELNDIEIKVLREQLRKKNSKGQLFADHIPLWDKIVEGEGPPARDSGGESCQKVDRPAGPATGPLPGRRPSSPPPERRPGT